MQTTTKETATEELRRIDLRQACEIEYWCHQLQINEGELMYAIIHAGPYVGNVKKFLKTSFVKFS